MDKDHQISGLMFNTADWGAGPDRTPTENRTALDAAVEACIAAGGGTVYIARGNYAPPGDL